jgi:hypothetical protein
MKFSATYFRSVFCRRPPFSPVPVSGFRFPVSGFRFPVSGFRFPVPVPVPVPCQAGSRGESGSRVGESGRGVGSGGRGVGGSRAGEWAGSRGVGPGDSLQRGGQSPNGPRKKPSGSSAWTPDDDGTLGPDSGACSEDAWRGLGGQSGLVVVFHHAVKLAGSSGNRAKCGVLKPVEHGHGNRREPLRCQGGSGTNARNR